MGKLIVNNFMTIDGFYDSDQGSLDEVFRHRWSGYTSIDEFDHYNLSLLRRCGTLVLAKNTFLGNKAHWAKIDDSSPESPVRKQLAQRFREMDKLVVGRSIEKEELEGWGPAKFVARDDYLTLLSSQKAKDERDFLVMMSRLMWNQMLAHHLVDELHLTVFPMALGSGRPIFSHRPDCAFRLHHSQVFPDAGNVLIVYDVLYEERGRGL